MVVMPGEGEILGENLQRAYDLVEQCKFDEAIDEFLNVGAWEDAAGLMNLYAQDFYEMGRVEVVLGWLEAIDRNELNNWPWLLLLQGRILTDDYSRHEQSLKIFNDVQLIFQEINDRIGEFKSKVWQSVVLRRVGECSRSLEIIEFAIADLQAIEDMWTRAWATRYQALSLGTVGQVKRSLDILEKCLVEFEEMGDLYHVGLCHHDLGVTLERLARIGEAERHYEDAVSVWQELGDKSNLINSSNSLAYLLCLTRQYDESLDRLNDCFVLAKDIESILYQAIVLESMADVFRCREDYLQAVDCYQMSTELAVKVSSGYLEICNQTHIAECFLGLGEMIKALRWVNKAIDSAKCRGFKSECGKAMALRSRIYMYQGRNFDRVYSESISCISGDILSRNREKLFLAHGLLFRSSRPLASYDLLLEVFDFLDNEENVILLHDVVAKTKSLFEYFLYHPCTNSLIRFRIEDLLKQNLVKRIDSVDLRIFGFGSLRVLICNGSGQSRCVDLDRLRGKTRYLPEFLMLLSLRGQNGSGLSATEVGSYLWPGLRIQEVKLNIKQLLQALGRYSLRACVKKIGRDRYCLVESWSDVSALLRLFTQSLDRDVLRREANHLYCGDFLEGYKLSENGKVFRAELKSKMLAV